MEAAIYVVVQQKQKHCDKHPLSLPTKKKKKVGKKCACKKGAVYVYLK